MTLVLRRVVTAAAWVRARRFGTIGAVAVTFGGGYLLGYGIHTDAIWTLIGFLPVMVGGAVALLYDEPDNAKLSRRRFYDRLLALTAQALAVVLGLASGDTTLWESAEWVASVSLLGALGVAVVVGWGRSRKAG